MGMLLTLKHLHVVACMRVGKYVCVCMCMFIPVYLVVSIKGTPIYTPKYSNP